MSARPGSATSARAAKRAEAKAQLRAEMRAQQQDAAERADASRPSPPLNRTDWWVALGVGLAAGVVFFSTFSSHVALGDAPETAAGVRSLGILHAPGYVTYVLAARLFGEVVRVGSWELRVNLFSLVCAALTVSGVYVLARCVGASKTGAAIGAGALATTVSFWFNAGFAKYNSFSALLVTAMALCVFFWQLRRKSWYLVAAGVLLGSSLGVSWQLALIMAVGLSFILVWSRPRPTLRLLLVAGAAALLAAVAVSVYIIVRAGQDPVVNYGNATGISRLFELLTTADFAGTRSSSGAGIGNVSGNSVAFLAILARDIGLGAIVLMFVGGFDVFARRRVDHALFFGVVALGNVVAIGLVSGKTNIAGFSSALVSGGQLTGALIVLAVVAALGASRVLYEIAQWRDERNPTPWLIGASAAMALVVIVPSLVVHFEPANHRYDPIGDRYARRVLAALPPNSVFLTGGYEFGQPILKRQVLYGDRPDVTVVFADNVAFQWYRDELVQRHVLEPGILTINSENLVTRAVNELRQKRPVYADTYAALFGSQLFAYRNEGLVSQVVEGTGPLPDPKFKEAAAALQREEVQDGMTNRDLFRFPNGPVLFFHQRAHVELAKQYALANDLDKAADELERALRFGSANRDRTAIDLARQHAPNARQVILGL